MKVLAVNGSPRKKWNTATLLEKALEGAASKGAETELVHLYDLDYKGCRSCFACKQKDSKSYGACAVKDGLAPVLKGIRDIDALVLGSPIYFGRVTGEMRSFMERLLFPYLEYGDPWRALFPRTIATGFIYTMNITEEEMTEMRLRYALESTEMTLSMIFGASEALYCYDTLQFEDHDNVVCDRVDVDAKMRRRRDVFPVDCEKAYALGVRMTRDVAGD
ncbi:flavodoxin family protein [Desulfoluna butyratoxydans]|uniref:Nadph-dependent fmn reductase-like n=1 Tax=Desulfoluna butyratoxydans TaxID=231438 RepID=A0A4U8YN49_9BACT|nr:flavodoxin family protein [Desulfoluna butyratoxydans]VFQ45004.1 nadph-dependent fmn reductase-like [Desulfoluna butyratoxydans]